MIYLTDLGQKKCSFKDAFMAINNGMLRHSLGGAVILMSLQHLIAPALDLIPHLPSWQRREAIKALNPIREQ